MSRTWVTVSITDPDAPGGTVQRRYDYELTGGMTALDVLCALGDGGPEFSACCRNEKCGVCAAMINGSAGLLCRSMAVEGMKLEPLRGFPVIRDLTVDKSGVTALLEGCRPYPVREGQNDTEPERVRLGDRREMFLRSSACIECMCCMSACPVWLRDRRFAGPMPLVRLMRYALDPRDTLDRAAQFEKLNFRLCLDCGSCTRVCPQGTDPRGIIREINKTVIEKEAKL